MAAWGALGRNGLDQSSGTAARSISQPRSYACVCPRVLQLQPVDVRSSASTRAFHHHVVNPVYERFSIVISHRNYTLSSTRLLALLQANFPQVRQVQRPVNALPASPEARVLRRKPPYSAACYRIRNVHSLIPTLMVIVMVTVLQTTLVVISISHSDTCISVFVTNEASVLSQKQPRLGRRREKGWNGMERNGRCLDVSSLPLNLLARHDSGRWTDGLIGLDETRDWRSSGSIHSVVPLLVGNGVLRLLRRLDRSLIDEGFHRSTTFYCFE